MWSLSSDAAPGNFEKTTELIPLATYGLTTVEEYRKAESDQHHQEWLRKAGLSDEEITLYIENQSGSLERHSKIEFNVLKSKLLSIDSKIKDFQHTGTDDCPPQTESNVSSENHNEFSKKYHNKSIMMYPEGHPMHKLKELEDSLFGHLSDDKLSLTKRRKILRRLERKKERLVSQKVHIPFSPNPVPPTNKPGSLWDVRDMPPKSKDNKVHSLQEREEKCSKIIGPKKPTMYTVKDNKIVRLEPLNRQDEFKAVDIVVPVNPAEAELLEGTKMSLDDIKKIDRFKNYEPGIPSKVLYLKNIAPSVTEDKLSSVFNQFIFDNRGPIDVRLMSGRMRGQAFVAFQNETVAIQALEEVNGTILSGRPIIVQFGKNSNRIQPDDKNR